jgi:hypothetical protein
MKKINIYVNGSPIHSKVISYLIDNIAADESIVINNRGMRFHLKDRVTEFNCAEDEYLSDRKHINDFFNYIQSKYGHDIKINLFTPHTNYLLAKIHSHMRMGVYNYIEDGVGTYAAILDEITGSNYFASAMAVDVRGGAQTLNPLRITKGLLVSFFYDIGTELACQLWRFSRMLSIDLFALFIRTKENYFNFQAPLYGNFYLSKGNFPSLRSVFIPTNLEHPKNVLDYKYLVLIPPRALIGNDFFLKFANEISVFLKKNPTFIFDYKLHPINKNKEDLDVLIKNGAPEGDVIEVNSSNETAFWAYEAGYGGIICYDSSASLYASWFLSPFKFSCFDMCSNVTGRDAFSDQIVRAISTL